MNTDVRSGVFIKVDSDLETRRLSSDFQDRLDGGSSNHSSNSDAEEKAPLKNGHAFSNGSLAVSFLHITDTDENLNESPGDPARKTEFIVAEGGDGDSDTTKSLRNVVLIADESLLSTFKQAALPFFLAGLGTVFAGLILDLVQFWPAFLRVGELFIVVPPLLGLKGNLEMTLAARLSTQANLGHMQTSRQIWDIAMGNMALVQVCGKELDLKEVNSRCRVSFQLSLTLSFFISEAAVPNTTLRYSIARSRSPSVVVLGLCRLLHLVTC